jgi:hypothetical protein
MPDQAAARTASHDPQHPSPWPGPIRRAAPCNLAPAMGARTRSRAWLITVVLLVATLLALASLTLTTAG